MITYAKIVNGTVSGSIQSTPITVATASGGGITELIANTSVTWDWGTSPVDANGVAIYPNYPYDSNGVFIGSFLKAAPATYTVNWNVIPIGFSASSITPLYDSAGTIQNFTTITPTKYTFTYSPNASPAQIVIKAGAVSNGELKLNNDVYSQAVATEYRPYVIPEIALMYGTGTGTGQVTNLGKSIVDTEVNPPVTRLYTSDYNSALPNKRAIKLTFVNFQDVPTSASEAGYSNTSTYRPFWFDSTDITPAISYSNIAQGTGFTPTNTATTYGFYINISTLTAYPATTAATRLSKVRAVEMSLGTNAYKYSGVLKFQVLKGSYYDKALGISNVDGPALYYGIFNYSYIVVDTLPTKPTGVTYANISTLKFKLNIYRALTDTSTTAVPTVTYGKIGPITVDATDPFGLTYTCTYTPSTTVASYIETVNIPNSWKVSKTLFTYYCYNQSSQKTFEVRQEPVKYTGSTAATNIVVPFLYFYTNTAVYNPITPVNLRVLAPDGSTKVTFNSILNGGTTITVPIQGYGLSGGTTYTVDIPTTYASDGYGNSLEDLTKTSIPRTFTLDSTPLTILSPVINSTLSVATPSLPVSFTFNKAVTSINSTATDFLSIKDITNASAPQTLASLQHDLYSTNFTDSPAISASNYTLPTTIRLNNNFNDRNSGGTRIFKIDRTYQLNINIPYCKDVFNNTGTLYSETFTVQKTPLNITYSSTSAQPTAYSSNNITLIAEQLLYKDNANAYIQLTTGSTTYRSDIDNLGVSITDNTITITPSTAIYLTSTTYTLTIPAGFVQDYVGNNSIAYSTTFTTVAMGGTRGEEIYTSGDNLFTVPFGVNSISVVLIGPGSNVPLSANSRISAGALAWVNSIPVVAGDVIHVSVDYYAADYTTLTKNGVVLVTAEGGTVGRRSMPLFDASIAGLEKGGQAGGLSAIDSQTSLGYDAYYYSHPGSAGGYTGYNSDPNICAHGADGVITSTSASGSGLSGTGSVDTYGQGGLTTYYYGTGKGGYINNPTNNRGAARIIWGPGRAFPSTDVA